MKGGQHKSKDARNRNVQSRGTLTTHQPHSPRLESDPSIHSVQARRGQDVPQGRPAWLGGSQKRSEPGADRFRDMPAPGESPMGGYVALCRDRAAVPPGPAPLPPGRGWRGSPAAQLDAALLAHGHQLRLLVLVPVVVHAERLHARGDAMSIGRGRGVWRGVRLAPSSSGRPPP